MHNRDLAKYYEDGELTMIEYLRIARDRDLNLPTNNYMGDTHEPDYTERFYEHIDEDFTTEDSESWSTSED